MTTAITRPLANYGKLVSYMKDIFKAAPKYKGNVHVYRKCPRCGYSVALVFKAADSWHLACPKCRYHKAVLLAVPTPAELDQAAREQDAAEKAAKKSAVCDGCSKRRKLNDQVIPGKALCKGCTKSANTVDM